MAARNNNILYVLLLFFSMYFFLSSAALWADPNLEEIQRRLNQETISKPFSVPDNAALTTALKEATDRGTASRPSGSYVAPKVPLLGGFGNYGAYSRPYYGGYYGGGYYNPFYGGWWW
jgi:hypothetical protein